jgi:hypothetical protein
MSAEEFQPSELLELSFDVVVPASDEAALSVDAEDSDEAA